MFADTDFLLALVKESDWLKGRAEKILKLNEKRITTSVSVMIEVAIVCQRIETNITQVFSQICGLIEVDETTRTLCLRASIFMERNKLNIFDAFHAAYCGNDAIISSDSAYDRIGLERIKLEKVPS
ncbi:PIN domain-containing protein [Candidatus Woesearchaeota archaeon]|nr:PIN domain-containing protein [Candidatus Woesearchaeota archaeon]